MKRLALLILAAAACLPAQELDSQSLLNPGTDSWPTYNGDYSGRRYSSLAQINQSNVNTLTLAWAFQSRSQTTFSSMPLVVNGIMYATLPNEVFAIDARTGRQIWRYQRSSQGGGNRGVAMWKDRLIFTTPDAHVICIDARNGKALWDIQIADPAFKGFASMAPLVVRDHVLVAGSGDAADLPGSLLSLDPMTGKEQWRWNVEPKPGEPGSETWPQDTDVMSRGGGMLWVTGTYDPELNLTYWGTGNPHPVENGEAREGANLYTCSIVALNPDTGKLVWYFQASPHDTHDWDTNMTPVLFDANYNGKPRKLLAQTGKEGLFFVLDRTNGKALVSAPLGESDWYSGWDERGQPIPRKETEPRPDGALVHSAFTNWNAPSYSPQTGLYYVNERDWINVYYLTMPGKKAEGWAGRDFTVVSRSYLKALDYQTGKVKWARESTGRGGQGGILTTAGQLLFTNDTAGNILALDPATGKTLWHMYPGGSMGSAPMTYELDGRQYLVIPVDGVLFAFTLPSH